MIEVIELTREEKQSWIVNGIRPCGSDINCIQSVVSNVLKTDFNVPMEKLIKRIWCQWMHKRWITATYNPEFNWVCHKCKRSWRPGPKRGILKWIKDKIK